MADNKDKKNKDGQSGYALREKDGLTVQLPEQTFSVLDPYRNAFKEEMPIEKFVGKKLNWMEKKKGYTPSKPGEKWEAAYSKRMNNYVAKKVLEANPLGDKNRVEWLSSFAPAEIKAIQSSNSKNKLKPNLLAQAENWMLGYNTSGVTAKNPNTTVEEAKQAHGNPFTPLEATQIVPNVVNSFFKNKDIESSMRGYPGNMGTIKSIILDPTTYIGGTALSGKVDEVIESGEKAFKPYLRNLQDTYYNRTRDLSQEEIEYLDRFGYGTDRIRTEIDNRWNERLRESKRELAEMRERHRLLFEQRTTSTNPDPVTLDRLREAFHTGSRVLAQDEIRKLSQHGFGNSNLYRRTASQQLDDRLNASDISRMNSDELRAHYSNRTINMFAPGTSEHSILVDRIINERYGIGASGTQLNLFNTNYNIPTFNKSSMSKNELIRRADSKYKDVIEKMSDDEFSNTALKPTGEVVPYYNQPISNVFTGKNAITPIERDDYIKRFNESISKLNEFIEKNNKTDVKYLAKELTPNEKLVFYTPRQVRQRNSGILFDRPIPEGESQWSLKINPGLWEGEVEDITSSIYLKSIPGINMKNTTGTLGSVFSDGIVRTGSGTYNALNEYLKYLNMGRVKSGFNIQTDYSRNLWEKAVKKGKAVGYYDDGHTVYASMKTLAPYAVPATVLGASTLKQKDGK